MDPPRGWLNCPAMGTEIIRGEYAFVALKTPLNDTFLVENDKKFSLRSMQSSAESEFERRIGLIVDLTNTYKYYRKEEVQAAAADCEYHKLKCKGHGIPSSKQTDEFIAVVKGFIKRSPGQLVGVHCTHGCNRTGYMICSFLVEVAQMGVAAAITTFKDARPPGIYKANYIQELCSVYNAHPLPVPAQPDWA